MATTEESNGNIQSNTIEISDLNFEPVSSFSRDITKVILYFVLTILLFAFGFMFLMSPDLLYVLFGVVSVFVATSSFVSNIKEFQATMHYNKASKELNDQYLKGIKPVCPYLRVDSKGFNCLIEFERQFDVVDDLPRCHIEELSVQHWKEKAPQVFDKLQNTLDKDVLTYIAALGGAKYEPAIPFLVDKIKLPALNKNNSFIVKSIDGSENIDMLKSQYLELVSPVKENDLRSDEEIAETNNQHLDVFDSELNKLEKVGIITISEDSVSLTDKSLDPNFLQKWNLYNSNLVKQYVLAALGIFESQELLPIFIEFILHSDDTKIRQHALNGLKRQKEASTEEIIKLIKSDELSENEKIALLDISGNFTTEEMFSFLEEIIQSMDETNDLLPAYAISSIGKFGSEGQSVILDVLQKNPGDLSLETGRSALAKSPISTMKLIREKLKEELTDDFVEILISIIEEMDYAPLKKEINNNWSSEEQQELVELFEDYEMEDLLDLFMPNYQSPM